MEKNKVRGTPITRKKVLLEEEPNMRAKGTRKNNTKRRAVTWKQFWTPQNIRILQSWVRKGWTNDKIREEIGISESTYYEWTKKHPEFSEVIQESREYCIAEVEDALFRKAKGIKEMVSETLKEERDDGYIEKTKRKEIYIPPDTKAAIFYLTNRDPENWKQKQMTELSGNISIDGSLDIAERLKGAAKKANES